MAKRKKTKKGKAGAYPPARVKAKPRRQRAYTADPSFAKRFLG